MDAGPLELDIDHGVIRQDLGYFLVMYSLAVVAGLLKSKPFDYALVIVLMVGYVYYVRRHFLTETARGRSRTSDEDIQPLYFWIGCGSSIESCLSGRRTARPRRRSSRSRSRSA